jgi:regulator of protease activity HflC (stomatin/prohibitin superfamily)
LIPFIDRVAHRVPLQEIPMDTEPQSAITRDNVTVSVDGILYYQVTDPRSAAYGTSDFRIAIELLAKTTLRSEIGKYELDKLLEERQAINVAVVNALDEASVGWGVKVLRYEVKDITPPEIVLKAMQMQLTAEREKRALIAKSEGQRTQKINEAEGERQAAIARSEGDKTAAINRAEGEAEAIKMLSLANAEAIKNVAKAIEEQGGSDAVNMKLAQQYIDAFAHLAKENNTMIIPSNLSDVSSMIASAMAVVKKQ